MYQRLSAHLNSVDLPAQLDRLSGENLKELSRETKSRVETAFSASSSASAGSARQVCAILFSVLGAIWVRLGKHAGAYLSRTAPNHEGAP